MSEKMPDKNEAEAEKIDNMEVENDDQPDNGNLLFNNRYTENL